MNLLNRSTSYLIAIHLPIDFQGKPSLLDYPGDETKYQSSEINKGEKRITDAEIQRK